MLQFCVTSDEQCVEMHCTPVACSGAQQNDGQHKPDAREGGAGDDLKGCRDWRGDLQWCHTQDHFLRPICSGNELPAVHRARAALLLCLSLVALVSMCAGHLQGLR